jgi:Ca2+-binding RTX toxin-like protein
METNGTDVRARIFNHDGTAFNRGGAEGNQDFVIDASAVSGQQVDPSITALANGGFVVTYTDQNGELENQGTRVQTFGADGRQQGASKFLVDLQQVGTQISLALATLSNGAYVAMYKDSIHIDEWYVRGRIFAADGRLVPGSEFTLSNPLGLDIFNVKIAALSNGRFVVTWHEGIGNTRDNYDVKAQIFEANGTKLNSEFRVNMTTRYAQEDADVAALPDGGFAVVFGDSTVATGTIRLAIFNNDGVRIGDEIQVDAPTADGHYTPSVKALADGRLVVTWTSVRDQQDDAFARIVDPRTQAIARSGSELDDHYIGTGFGDMLGGGAGADRLRGEGGNDTLDGGTGIDHLIGGTGNDTYRVDTAADAVVETAGGGWDTVLASGSYALAADLEVEVLNLSGVSSRTAASLTGSDTANEITGHAGTNTLKGQGGHDVLKASLGNDSVYGGTGNDKVYGGAGNDRLYGEAGRDMFVFDTRTNKRTNVDKVYDFRSRDDSFHLDNKVFTKLGSGTEARPKKFKADMFVENSRAQDAEDRIVYDRKTGNLYYDQDGTGSKAQVKIATLTNKAKLYWHDFFVI